MRLTPVGVAVVLVVSAAALQGLASLIGARSGHLAPARDVTDPFVLGERAVAEAVRWIAKDGAPVENLTSLHAEVDYRYDDGSHKDERTMELWFRSPDALHLNFAWGGVPTTFILNGPRAFMIRDALHVRDLTADPTLGPKVISMLENDRAVIKEVGRILVPKGPGVRFRLERRVPNPAAGRGPWFEVVRTAPREPTMTYFFRSAPRPDGRGVRAIAPDRVIVHGDRDSTYAGDEYRLEGWLRDDAEARREPIRYPKKIRLYAIGIDPEDRPTLRVVVNAMELNEHVDPVFLTDPRASTARRPDSKRPR